MAFWEYPTNYSNGTSIDGVAKMFFQYPNYILGGYAGAGWTLLIFLFSFGISLGSGSKKALGIAGWIGFLFSIYFIKLGILNMVISFVLLIIAIIGTIGSKSEGGYM